MEPLKIDEYKFMNDFPVVHEINLLKQEIDSLRPIDKEQEDRIMQKFRLDWNYNSNAIEGNSLDYGETVAFLMQGVTAKGKPLKDYLDIRGHNEVIDYLMHLVKNKEELSERDIRGMHEMLLVEPYENPSQTENGIVIKRTIKLGEYKRMPNHVRTVTGEIHYYATPEDTPFLMRELVDWYRSAVTSSELHPVIIAAIFHHRFTSIHPFDDGNGRMSRLLMNLILMQYSYPPVVIKNTDKNHYYLVLSQADTGDIESFVKYIADNLINSLTIYLKGAKGESVEEQSDLRKKLSLFKKEVQARRDKIEVKKSPEVIKELYTSSISHLINSLNITLLDFKDLFFDYKESYLKYDSKWVYEDARISEQVEYLFNNSKNNIETVAYKFLHFKLAEDSFSIELKLSFMLSELDYYVFYSFSENDELTRVTSSLYSQWLGESLNKRYYHQAISTEESDKMTNKIGESLYEFIKAIFDKKISYKPVIIQEYVYEVWTDYVNSQSNVDHEKVINVHKNSVLEILHDKSIIKVRTSNHLYNGLETLEKINIESGFFNALNKRIQSARKVFIELTPQL